MQGSCEGFLEALAISQPKNRELGVAVLWWHLRFQDTDGLGLPQIVQEIENAGYAKQNRSRLWRQLAEDRRTRKVGRDKLGISVRIRDHLDAQFQPFAKTRLVKESDSVLPRSMFEHTRIYLERVVAQINVSYDSALYDCTAVMCRRLLETLIIEVYERQVRADALKGGDGHFLMFGGLLDKITTDAVINLGRGAVRGLKALKRLGDLSAHNRRFNAREQDIDRLRDDIRVASEELLHLAFPLTKEGVQHP